MLWLHGDVTRCLTAQRAALPSLTVICSLYFRRPAYIEDHFSGSAFQRGLPGFRETFTTQPLAIFGLESINNSGSVISSNSPKARRRGAHS